MSEGAGGGIFMDIMPRLESTSLGAVVQGLTAKMSQLGKTTGAAFGKDFGVEAGTASQKLAAQLERDMQAAQRAVEKSMEGMIRAQNNVINSTGKVEVAQLKLNDAIGKYGEGSAKAVAAANNLTRAHQEQDAAMRGSTQATNAQTAATNDLAAASARQQEAMDASAASAGAFGTALNVAGLVITAGFLLAVDKSVKAAGAFETTQTRLVTSAGMSAGAIKTVSDGILQMSGQVGVSAQELSTAMYTVSSGMVHSSDAAKEAADSLAILKAASQGAKMEGAETKTVADAITTALHDYHLSADQAANVTSKMVTAVSMGKTTLEEFAGSLHTVQPLAGALNISIDSLYGTLAAMTASGESADQATQHMEHALTKLQAATNPMTNELASFGIQSSDLAAKLSERGLAGSLQYISETIKNKFGPAATIEIDAFNQSQVAATKAKEAHDHLAPSVQALADQVHNGTLGTRDFIKATSQMGDANAAQAQQWLSLQKNTDGFSAAIKSGSTPAIQSYQQAMQLATGDMSTMDVALMVTGDNAEQTNKAIDAISKSSADAGGNVKGWDDIQGTFNQKMSEFKGAIGATAISIGNDFLPAATSIAQVLSDVGIWLTKNKGFLDALMISVGSAAAAFVVFKTVSAMWTVMDIGIKAAALAMGWFTAAEGEATVGAGGLAAALAATGISEIVLGVTALVAAIAAMVVGVKYAYDHWSWFHTAVQAVWSVLKAVGEWIAGVAVGAWHLLAAAIGPIETAFKAIGSAAMWLWHNAIEPAMNGVGLALRVVGAVVLTVLAVPFVLAFKLIEAAVKFVYNEIIKPTFDQIAEVFHWLYDNAVEPVVGFIKDQITGMGIAFNWLHDNVIQPVFNAIADVWHWIYDTIIHPIVEAIKTDIDAWGVVFHWLYDNAIKPVGDLIGTAMDGLKTAFKDVVDWLKTQWDRIIGIVSPPIKFIVDTVYNEGIVPVWNDIAGVFGLGKLDKVNGGLGGGSSDSGGTSNDGSLPVSALAATHAGGGVWQGAGVLPGYAPGKDIHNAILSPGEGVAVPELVQAIGPQRFMALNYAYSNGRKPGSGPGFDAGTIFGSVGNAIDDVGNVLTGGGFDQAKFMAKLLADPEGAIRDKFSDMTDKTASTPGGASNWLDAAKSIPTKFLDAAVQKALSWAKTSMLGAGGEAWVSGAGAEQWAPVIMQALALEGFPTTADYVLASEAQIMTESSGDPNRVQQILDVNSGGNEGRGLVQVTPGTAASLGLAELGGNIYDPLTNLRLGLRWLKTKYGGDLLGTWGHGHGYEGGGIVGYAGGGISPTVAADRAAIDRALNWARGEEGGAYNKDGWLDCSGLISGLYNSVQNKTPARAFTTMSDFTALGFKKGTGGIFEIGVNPKPGAAGHMAATLDGHNIESGGSHNNIAVDGAAAGAMDAQFTDHYYLPGSLFDPKWTGTGATADATSKTNDKLSADATKWSNAAQKALQNEQKATDAATKHDQNAAKYEEDATKADELAAKTSGDAKAKHVAAAAHYRELAQKAKAAADKDRANAEKYKQTAADDQAKADAAKNDKTTSKDTTKSTTSTDSGPVKAMSLHDFGSRLGGIAADAITETLGVSNTVFADPTKSVFVKIANALAGAKWGQYSNSTDQNGTTTGTTDSTGTTTDTTGTATDSTSTTSADTVQPATTTDTTDDSGSEDADGNYTSADVVDSSGDSSFPEAQVFDSGGWLQPGKLAINLTRKPEPVLAPRDSDHLQALAQGGGNNSSSPRAYVIIENQHVNGGDGRAVGRDIYREMLAYQGAGGR